jgi:hypothetical protein
MTASVLETREGGCLCGAVRFQAGLSSRSFGACHCQMCRRWTGSALLAISVPSAQIVWQGAEHIARFQSSDWAERANCRICGSALFYRVTGDGPGAGDTELPIGSFDNADGLTFDSEIYVDLKPDCYDFAGSRPRLNEQQTLERFGISDQGVLT